MWESSKAGKTFWGPAILQRSNLRQQTKAIPLDCCAMTYTDGIAATDAEMSASIPLRSLA
jgi:hypothetical protein